MKTFEVRYTANLIVSAEDAEEAKAIGQDLLEEIELVQDFDHVELSEAVEVKNINQ